MNIEIDRAGLDDLCVEWEIDEFSVFGSALTDAFTEDSDIDVLVRFPPKAKHSLLDLVRLKSRLTSMFGRDVDLVEDESLQNPYRRKAILNSREVVYAR